MAQHDIPKVVWITGASSGIGRALALRLARAGSTVATSARSTEKLAEAARENVNLRLYPVDVTDAASVSDVVRRIEADLGPIDLAVLNAGVWHPMTASRYDLAKATESMAVNYGGVTNALAHVMPSMITRGRGHIVFIASVAGYRGLPKSAAYAPTKAAIISLAESLYADLKLKGVTISVINPGFIATPMTAENKFPMPYIVSEDFAARAIERAIRRGSFETVFPWQMAIMMKSLRLLPYRVFFFLMSKIARRETPVSNTDEMT